MADNTNINLRNMMIYQIFVRNYSEEGSFAAVEADLDRIKSLGTDIVYLLPIHPIGVKNRKGSLGSPYAIRDYRAINPEYGTMEDFRSLVNAIHMRGMGCIIDVVYNHTSPDSVLAEEHPEWFYHDENGAPCGRVADWADVVDLDYSHPELWDYQIETLKMWAGIVDGFRCDVASLVPIEFWERARREVESVHPGCIWLAESVHPQFIIYMRSRGFTVHSDCEMYRAFDICYDYDVFDLLEGYLKGENSLKEYTDVINRQEYIYPGNYIKLRFIENHDRARAASLVSSVPALRNLLAFSFFQKGTAFVYAGQEFGRTHLPSLFDKDTVTLEPENGVDLSDDILRLCAIKKDPIFRNSVYQLSSDGDTITATHTCGDRKLTGVFSLKGDAMPVITEG
ncbi:MAG: alpha-amylase [Lachnospiraceae bacterium]|nr:alpha-amylase [Lachnospiraceae bacterium]